MWVVQAISANVKKTLPVPLAEPAKTVLERRKGLHDEYVFTGPGRVFGSNVGVQGPLDSIKLPWKEAIAKAGVPDLRFHDLRHAWASFHTMNETPERVLQALGGWSSSKMVQRYAHLKPNVLAEYAGNVKLK